MLQNGRKRDKRRCKRPVRVGRLWDRGSQAQRHGDDTAFELTLRFIDGVAD
jgi:hypothetical protein